MHQTWQNEHGSLTVLKVDISLGTGLRYKRYTKKWGGKLNGILLVSEEFEINDYFPQLMGTALVTMLDVPSNTTEFAGLGKIFIEWDSGDSLC